MPHNSVRIRWVQYRGVNPAQDELLIDPYLGFLSYRIDLILVLFWGWVKGSKMDTGAPGIAPTGSGSAARRPTRTTTMEALVDAAEVVQAASSQPRRRRRAHRPASVRVNPAIDLFTHSRLDPVPTTLRRITSPVPRVPFEDLRN